MIVVVIPLIKLQQPTRRSRVISQPTIENSKEELKPRTRKTATVGIENPTHSKGACREKVGRPKRIESPDNLEYEVPSEVKPTKTAPQKRGKKASDLTPVVPGGPAQYLGMISQFIYNPC